MIRRAETTAVSVGTATTSGDVYMQTNADTVSVQFGNGAALTATSVGITARVLGDLRALATVEARTVLGAAVADDAAIRGAGVDPAHVVLTASSSESYSWLFKLWCDPGDRVLVPQPSYPLFEHLTSLDALEAVPYALEYHGRWSIDLEAFERALCGGIGDLVQIIENQCTRRPAPAVQPRQDFGHGRGVRRVGDRGKRLPQVSDEAVLSGVTCSCGAGETLAVIGSTGSGKTTQVPQMLLDGGLAKDRRSTIGQWLLSRYWYRHFYR